MSRIDGSRWETSTDRTVEISVVQGDKEMAKDNSGGIGIEEGDVKSDLLGDGVSLGNQRVAISVEGR